MGYVTCHGGNWTALDPWTKCAVACARTLQLHCKFAGDQFALFEAVVALAMLMRRYEFTIDPAAPEVHTLLKNPQYLLQC